MGMNETVEEFCKDVNEQIKVQASENGISYSEQFVRTILNDLADTKLVCNPIVRYWSGNTTNRASILLYGYDFDDISHSMSLYTADFQDEEEPHILQRSKIEELAEKALRFPRECVSENSSKFKKSLEDDAYDLYDMFLRELKGTFGLTKIKVILFSNGLPSSRAKTLPATNPISGIDTVIEVWHIERLYEMLGSSLDYEETEFDLEHDPDIKDGGLPCLKIPQQDENLDCYLAVIPGTFLARIYHEYGSQLLEGNIRAFLSTKTDVNKKIQGTINKAPTKFFIYNNGIAVTATSLDIKTMNGMSRIVKIKNMQIINGGQTTASLAYAKEKGNADISAISVQMKITVIKLDNPDEVATIVQTIAETSNSQNKVSAEDFFSNHDFHKEMKRISESTTVPPKPMTSYSTYCYYERVKGQYRQETMFYSKAKKNEFYLRRPDSQKMTKAQFARYSVIEMQKPYTVSKGAKESMKTFQDKVVKDWEIPSARAKYNTLFYKRISVIGALYRKLEDEITIKKQSSWYLGSYRANVIAYTLSLFFKKLSIQFPNRMFDFICIWDTYSLIVPDPLTKQLIDIAKEVYATLTDPERSEQNVTQWAKKEECWLHLQEKLKTLMLQEELLEPYLKDRETVLSTNDDAREFKKMENQVNLMHIVLGKPYLQNWPSLSAYIQKKPGLFHYSIKQIQALQLLVRFANGKAKSTPTIDQCKNCLQIWDDATNMGWKPEV